MGSYLRPSLLKRWLEPLLMVRLAGQPHLRVTGRSSGRLRLVPVRPLPFKGCLYLVSLPGETHWARNLRAAGGGELVERGRRRTIRTVEVFERERAAVVAEYLATSRYEPTRRLLTERLPNPADHPVFRVE